MTKSKMISLLKTNVKKWNEWYDRWKFENPYDVLNLTRATLTRANLYGANLTGATLTGATLPAPSMSLLANWGEVSDDLCLALMRHDCSNHPEGAEAFDRWATGNGTYPYSSCAWGRAANFREKKELWKPGRAQSALKLAQRLIAEKCKHESEAGK